MPTTLTKSGVFPLATDAVRCIRYMVGGRNDKKSRAREY